MLILTLEKVANMAQSLPEGTQLRHRTGCPMLDGGARCRCRPAYRLRLRLGDGRRVSATFDTLAEATAWRAEQLGPNPPRPDRAPRAARPSPRRRRSARGPSATPSPPWLGSTTARRWPLCCFPKEKKKEEPFARRRQPSLRPGRRYQKRGRRPLAYFIRFVGARSEEWKEQR